jgi:mRNA-degrading endonuclease RelE of RelBE toxin-antitoxin system
MAFKITLTREFQAQLSTLRARDRRTVEGAILSHLQNQPARATKAIKPLRPNAFAEYELRAGALRVLYNMVGNEVVLLAVGRKVGNKLIIAGEEFHGHQDDPSEPAGNGPAEDAE